MTSDDYQSGKRDGRIEAIQNMQVKQNERLDSHNKRILAQERIVWGLIGAITLIEVLPSLKAVL